jgi:hypothetical protein
MEMTIDMPFIESCTINECAYNKDDMCHARAITIGDGVHPGCDTSLLGTSTHTRADGVAGVGACKVTNCMYNSDLECEADSITVSMKRKTIQCMTYSARA